jgi:hypothetical protein
MNDPTEWTRTAMARPLDETAVQVTMWADGRQPVGPWSFVTDLPNPNRDMLGPPPGYLALAGWAT